MADFEDRKEQKPKRRKPTMRLLITIALIGIFVVLTLANWRAIRTPLDALSEVLAPIVIGLVIAYILNFFVRFFEFKLFKNYKRRVLARALAMILSYLLAIAIIAGMIWLILPSAFDSCMDLLANRSAHATRLFDSIENFINGLSIKGFDSETLKLPALREKVLTFLDSPEDLFTKLAGFLGDPIVIVGDVITVLKNVVVGIFISIYVLLSKERLAAGCRRVFHALLPEKAEQKTLHYCSVAHNKFGGYMVGKLTDSMLVMLTCLLLFHLFDIPYATLIAVIVGVTDIIPFFGPFLGAIPSALIILIADPPKVILFLVLILVVQQIDGNILAPAILGEKTGLTSLGVIIAVTLMGSLLGIPGMIIGVPLFALIITLLDDFIKSRLAAKGADTDLYTYFPADAFLKPQDFEKEHATFSRRIVNWVKSVETERAGVDYKPSPLHTFWRGIRRFILGFFRFFHHLFSMRPIEADRKNWIYRNVAQNGMRDDRNFGLTVFLSIITLGIYPLYLVRVIAKTTNIACRRDKKRTWGALPYLFLSIITLGVFGLIWHCANIRRFRNYCRANGEDCRISRRFFLCWSIFGALILVGPFIALSRFMKAYNQVCSIYNDTHSFPLTPEDLKEDADLEARDEKRDHVPLIDQIAPTHDFEEVLSNETEDEKDTPEPQE